MHADEPPFDVIVIGSGLGGLTAGSLLAEAGRRVLILERHSVPGGFTHTFTRKGFTWDVGVHYVGQMQDAKGILRRVFDRISDGKLKWEPMGKVYDRVRIGTETYDYVTGADRQIDAWIARFPGEEKSIRRYVSTVKSTSASSAWYFGERTMPRWLSFLIGRFLRRPFERMAARTTDEVLREITPNAELRAVFAAQCGNYGLHPTESSFGILAIVADHYLEGGSYPVGGAAEVFRTLAEKFRTSGGVIRLKSEVSELLRENDRADARVVGVKLASGEEVRARAIISNAGAANTFGRLLRGRSTGDPTPFIGEGVGPSTAHVCLYVGLNASDADLNIPRHNLWIYDRAFFNREPDAVLPAADPLRGDGITYISFPSAKDPAFPDHSPNRATIQVIAPCAYAALAQWEGTRWARRGDDYLEWKRKVSERLLKVLLHELPQLAGHVAYSELSTPLSTEHFSAHPRGEIYGLDHRPARFAPAFARKYLRPETSVPGLYLTGQDIVTVGVGGALYSGVLAATKVLNKSVIVRILMGWKL